MTFRTFLAGSVLSLTLIALIANIMFGFTGIRLAALAIFAVLTLAMYREFLAAPSFKPGVRTSGTGNMW